MEGAGGAEPRTEVVGEINRGIGLPTTSRSIRGPGCSSNSHSSGLGTKVHRRLGPSQVSSLDLTLRNGEARRVVRSPAADAKGSPVGREEIKARAIVEANNRSDLSPRTSRRRARKEIKET